MSSWGSVHLTNTEVEFLAYHLQLRLLIGLFQGECPHPAHQVLFTFLDLMVCEQGFVSHLFARNAPLFEGLS